jgi:hypothetical protein
MPEIGNSALVVAHPGHELILHHWMERHRPLYCCLTDGSGGGGASRIESTSRLLLRAGAMPGPIFGRYTDREIYRFVLEGRVDIFVALRDELASALLSAEIVAVAGDAMEGFNPIHDLCRALIDAAVSLAEVQTGRTMRNDEFALDHLVPQPGDATIELDADALERKLAAGNDYPEMQREIDWAMGRFGVEHFAAERLRPSTMQRMMDDFAQREPAYERYGQLRVTEGRYRHVIRYQQHVLPLFAALGIAATQAQAQWTR